MKRGAVLAPVVLALLHGPGGVEVDAVLASEREASIVFGFACWYFLVAGPPRATIGFLRSILPRKRLAELYISIGYHKHGKTELYRDILAHLSQTEERFELAQGDRGLVMVVFTLPSLELVFKVIRTRFLPPKSTSRAEVKNKYKLVFRQDRAGRLADAQEFARTYANPLYRLPITFIEIFPVGVLITFVSAAVLRNSRILPARRV